MRIVVLSSLLLKDEFGVIRSGLPGLVTGGFDFDNLEEAVLLCEDFSTFFALLIAFESFYDDFLSLLVSRSDYEASLLPD